MYKERIILLSVRKYSFNDAETKRLIEGTTATYLSPYTTTDPDRKGQESQSCPCDASVFAAMPNDPCFADALFETRPNFKGKATLTLTAGQIKKPLDLQDAAAK